MTRGLLTFQLVVRFPVSFAPQVAVASTRVALMLCPCVSRDFPGAQNLAMVVGRIAFSMAMGMVKYRLKIALHEGIRKRPPYDTTSELLDPGWGYVVSAPSRIGVDCTAHTNVYL
jgi:hypothetical protein